MANACDFWQRGIQYFGYLRAAVCAQQNDCVALTAGATMLDG
jgi:hypothetical protein